MNDINGSNSHWILQSMVDSIPWTIAIVIVLFNIIGHFGNFNLIYATIKNKNLQSKHGWLLVFLCSEHSICLFCEFINVFFALTGIPISRRNCLLLLSPYISISLLQSTTFVTLAVDVLLSCFYAVEYQKWDTVKYMIILTITPFFIPLSFMILVWSRVSDEVIFLCNPPLSMDNQTVNIWGGFLFSINLFILFLYSIVYGYSIGQNRKTRQARLTRKLMKSLTILVLVFCISWVTCISLVFLVEYITSNPLLIILIRSYAVIFAVIAYSQTFYVYYLRSEMYRRKFKKQFWPKKKISMKVMSMSF